VAWTDEDVARLPDVTAAMQAMRPFFVQMTAAVQTVMTKVHAASRRRCSRTTGRTGGGARSARPA
jgi:hypothetical protein